MLRYLQFRALARYPSKIERIILRNVPGNQKSLASPLCLGQSGNDDICSLVLILSKLELVRLIRAVDNAEFSLVSRY
jgi:hypothetical protein